MNDFGVLVSNIFDAIWTIAQFPIFKEYINGVYVVIRPLDIALFGFLGSALVYVIKKFLE